VANFYLDEGLTDAAIGARLSFGGAEARHAVAVSRTRVGESLLLGNGRGLVISGTVLETAAASVVVEVVGVRQEEAPRSRVILAQALAKGDRDELAVQAATELGVDGIVPWAAERSVVRWQGDKVVKGHQRWATIVREATKQSMRPWLPDVHDLATTKDLAGLTAANRVLVLEPTAKLPLSEVSVDGEDFVLVVGPEGGIAPAELDRLTEARAEMVRLGSNVLRTSTAGPAALAILNVALGRF
jgi:16S rRNA (uracil1498-N3)-methyltransferase